MVSLPSRGFTLSRAVVLAAVVAALAATAAAVIATVRRDRKPASPPPSPPSNHQHLFSGPKSNPVAPATAPFAIDGITLPTPTIGAAGPATKDVVSKLREKLATDPADVKTRVQLAASLDSMGEASEAEDVLRAALQRGQKTPEVFHALGTVYLRNGIHAGALQAFLVETRLAPKSFDAHFALGTTYVNLQRTDEARREYEIAQKLNPNNPDVYLWLAFVNNGSDRYPFAVKYLEQYINRAPQPGPGYGLLSRVYLNMRVFDKSMEAGKKAVESMPDNPYVWYNLGQAYLYQPDNRYLNEAADALKKAIEFLPSWGNANFELGRAYARLGKNEAAISAYREAVKASPAEGRFQYQLGQLLIKSGQADEGNRMLAGASRLITLNQKATRLLNQITAKPDDTRRLFELSQVYKQTGEYPRALNVLDALLEVDPKHAGARSEMEAIRKLADSGSPSDPASTHSH